ncbi:protection of telomeres protein 1 [Pelodytes ibericus]
MAEECEKVIRQGHPLPKYTYTSLNQLKEGMVVNLFGVVKFFKPPYRSKGTDFCSVVTLVDQSDVKLKCLFFNENRDALPKIYKVGDIVRFHRIKIQKFNNEIQGITTSGFSSLAFDGTVGAPITPTTSSKSYSFNSEDKKTVEVLRDWAANHLTFPVSRSKLSAIQPEQYFDLACQLVGKAEVDKSSYLLKVWDGSKCVSRTWKVCVEEAALEGDGTFINQLQNLTVDILVYDNHVETAKSLKVGSYLVIHCLHVKLHKVNSENQLNAPYLEFYLHGGTCHGRGITVLPENNYDVQELQKFLDSVDLQDYQGFDDLPFQELTCLTQMPLGQELPPSDVLERRQQLSVTVLPDHHQWQTTPLATVIKRKVPNKYRIRAQLRSFEPRNLYQSVKLHCTKCKSLQDIPDEKDLNIQFQKYFNSCLNPNVQNAAWYQSAAWTTNNERNRSIGIHFVKKHDMQQNPEDTLIMIEGGTFLEIYKLSRHFGSIIPVKSNHEQLEIDLTCPFLIQGNRWHYGCRNCSNVKSLETLTSLSNGASWNDCEIARALGVKQLRHVFVMCLTLEDETGLLNAYLWNFSEQFFQIPVSEICMDSKLQEDLQNVLDTLCPSRKKLSEFPWLDCCIRSYNSTDGRKEQTCYEIFDTVVTGTV